ncbi:MAG: choice-of-anchor Q domain-containing protein, partial [Rhodanobacteraceae bacterium]
CIDASFADSRHNNVAIFNTILWPGDIKADTSGWIDGNTFNLSIHNSIYGQLISNNGTLTETESLHTDPLWRNPSAGDYSLQVPPAPISPAINSGAGAASVPGGISASDVDIAGVTRLIGSAPDIGAYESAVDDGALFAVTTTDDCSTPLNQPSCGSLRDAIARATAPTATAPVKTVKFWITDWMLQPVCPAEIHLNSGLPDITSNVVIDGFSQGSINEIDPPLSWPNIDPYIFNASLCIAIIGPGSGYGLRVPAGSNGSLTLRGVGLGGFGQGIMLLGGANHQIAGNQFGGVTNNGTNLHGFSADAINVSPSVQPSGALIIGGDNYADRNVFLNAFSFNAIAAKAILMQSNVVSDPNLCQIVGNLVGIQPDGTSATGNDYGMILSADGCTIKNNWIAGNHTAGMWIQGQHYVVQGNVLGLAPRSFAQQNNGGPGILINGSNNTIGASASSDVLPPLFDQGEGNYIQDFMDSGIAVFGAATANTLRGNSLLHTGFGTGNPAIDLGDDGATGNDASDLDTGANGLQNFPVLHGLSWSSPPQPGTWNSANLGATLVAQPGTYNVDAFLGEGCDANGRGHPEVWIGRATVTVTDAAVPTAMTVPASVRTDYFDPALASVTLMATNMTDGNTSEVGVCLAIDAIFKDGFEM